MRYIGDTSTSRMKLLAFVCEGGVVREAADEGFSRYNELITRADACRFMVVEMADGSIRCYDTFAVAWSPYPDVDTAVASAVLQGPYQPGALQILRPPPRI